MRSAKKLTMLKATRPLIAGALLLTQLAYSAFAQTGTPGIPQFDSFMSYLMAKYGIPGAALTITKNGRIVMARGYGLMDQENNVPMQPDTLLRIASISKTITAVAVMRLVEAGKLSLDQPAFALLPNLQSPDVTDKDPRLATITIRNLLNHTAGWDASKSGFDPTGSQAFIAEELGVPSPASADNMVRYMRGQMLDTDPGLYYAYSNFGYDVLGRIIERVSGMSYEQYVRLNVLAPMGISTARIATTLPAGQRPGEAKYYANQKTQTIFPDVNPKSVSLPYGAWYMEGFDADGGWIISAVDFTKLLNAIDGQRGSAFLTSTSVAQMTARPSARNYDGQSEWYGFGMEVQPTDKGQIWWNDGAIDGTFTHFIRTDDGLVITAFLNSRSNPADRESALQNETDAGLSDAAAQVMNWPAADYSSMFPDADPAKTILQPALNTAESTLNAASFDRGIVPGSWASLFGVNLSHSERGWTKADFNGSTLPTSLDGVSVKIAGQPAPVAYVSPGQINVQVPSPLKPGWVTVEVVNNGVSAGTVLTWLTDYAPGAFTFRQQGTKFATATSAEGALLTPGHPCRPGDVIVLYATGVAPAQSGSLIPTPRAIGNVEVRIGGQPATIQYAGLIEPGVFQINAVVPDVAGGNQAVHVVSSAMTSPDGIFLPVATN